MSKCTVGSGGRAAAGVGGGRRRGSLAREKTTGASACFRPAALAPSASAAPLACTARCRSAARRPVRARPANIPLCQLTETLQLILRSDRPSGRLHPIDAAAAAARPSMALLRAPSQLSLPLLLLPLQHLLRLLVLMLMVVIPWSTDHDPQPAHRGSKGGHGSDAAFNHVPWLLLTVITLTPTRSRPAAFPTRRE